MIREGKGVHFDPDVIDAFFDVLPTMNDMVGLICENNDMPLEAKPQTSLRNEMRILARA